MVTFTPVPIWLDFLLLYPDDPWPSRLNLERAGLFTGTTKLFGVTSHIRFGTGNVTWAKSARGFRWGFIWKSWRSLGCPSVSLKHLRLFLWFSQGQRAGPCPPHRVWREKTGSSWGGWSSIACSSSFLGNSPTKHTLTQLIKNFTRWVCVCRYIVTGLLSSRIILSCKKVLHYSTKLRPSGCA